MTVNSRADSSEKRDGVGARESSLDARSASRSNRPTNPAKPSWARANSRNVAGAEHGERLSLSGACRVLGVSPNTLRRWDKKGLIAAERTVGGQRRFPIAEIQRVLRQRAQTEQDTRPATVGPSENPEVAIPQAASALSTAKQRLLALREGFYQWNDIPKGYFAGKEGARWVEDVLDFFERDLRRGEYGRTIAAVRDLSAQAMRGGVSVVESFRFWELLTESISVIASPLLKAPGTRREQNALRKLLRSLTHHYLDELDNPRNLIGGRGTKR